MKKIVKKTALVLAAVGAINWGLTALSWNAVQSIFGFSPMLVTVIYALVGISGIWALVDAFS